MQNPNRRSAPRQRARRTGLTLVEWLVILVILIVLAALLLPNVRVAREAARRMQCSNNLKQIVLALHNYERSFKCFPTAMGGTGVGATELLGNANRLSGVVPLLNYLESSSVWNAIAAPLEANGMTYPAMGPAPWVESYPPWQTKLSALSCPSQPVSTDTIPPTNYAFCIGDIAAEIHNPTAARGVFACRLYTKFEDITDGTSQTIAIAEIGSPDGRAAIGQIATDQSSAIGENPSLCLTRVRDSLYLAGVALSENGRGARWTDGAAHFSLFATILPPNRPSCSLGNSPTSDGIYSAGSRHTAGINLARADGSVSFVSENIDSGDTSATPPRISEQHAQPPTPYGAWGALGTAADGEISSTD